MIAKYTVDAKDRTIGRIASEAASLLSGKNRPDFAKNVIPEARVSIINASKTKIPEKKLLEKEYYKFSGYPSGRKSQTLKRVIEKSGIGEVFKNAIYGMLPKNRLRKIKLKNLTVTN